jgi:hypothetical protein
MASQKEARAPKWAEHVEAQGMLLRSYRSTDATYTGQTHITEKKSNKYLAIDNMDCGGWKLCADVHRDLSV